jgi:uncharacterized protein YqjF (DUF2071 family)
MPSPERGFNHAILDITSHRPWLMPETAWVMTQTWHHLLFAHWPVDADLLRQKVPKAFPLDLFEGRCWLGIVPFHMTNVAPRLMPALPWISEFPELNVRTYVRVGEKPGVYFFSLDAANPLAVGVARILVHLPYYRSAMRVEERDGWIHYTSRRTAPGSPAAEFGGRYRPTGDPVVARPGTLEYFLTERYCLYTVDGSARPFRLEIHHPPWPLQSAEAIFTVNTMAEACGIALPPGEPLLHFARRQDMVAWPLESIEARG